ncbi:MAG: hypothetical protein Satyrvirus15_20 [Satyrvirus sp.]|uniref:Uncharacterized protein n=1 Tax=Satyrvirus sp. TaxID=2487771 RepID=A0A3G5AI08_9VIRU|nr:MAG: hypothetical protein Satyrvirus15_20 [Satyrvirus sp.]
MTILVLHTKHNHLMSEFNKIHLTFFLDKFCDFYDESHNEKQFRDGCNQIIAIDNHRFVTIAPDPDNIPNVEYPILLELLLSCIFTKNIIFVISHNTLKSIFRVMKINKTLGWEFIKKMQLVDGFISISNSSFENMFRILQKDKILGEKWTLVKNLKIFDEDKNYGSDAFGYALGWLEVTDVVSLIRMGLIPRAAHSHIIMSRRSVDEIVMMSKILIDHSVLPCDNIDIIVRSCDKIDDIKKLCLWFKDQGCKDSKGSGLRWAVYRFGTELIPFFHQEFPESMQHVYDNLWLFKYFSVQLERLRDKNSHIKSDYVSEEQFNKDIECKLYPAIRMLDQSFQICIPHAIIDHPELHQLVLKYYIYNR